MKSILLQIKLRFLLSMCRSKRRFNQKNKAQSLSKNKLLISTNKTKRKQNLKLCQFLMRKSKKNPMYSIKKKRRMLFLNFKTLLKRKSNRNLRNLL